MSENINLGTFTAPYREFTFDVAPGQIYSLRYDHQIVEILENNLPNDVDVSFGSVGGFTKLESGIAYRYPDNNIIPLVQFRNNHATNTAHLHVAMAAGNILDNRLVLSGIINVQSSQANPLYNYSDVYTDSSGVEKTIDGTGSVTISDFTTPTDGFKSVLIQNTSSADVRIGSASGFILAPTGTFEWKVPTKALTIYGTNGQTVYCEGYK